MAIEKPASPPANKRRYDSIATLLQGDEVCGASCFDGKNLLLATNSAQKTEFVKKVLLYFKRVAQKCSERVNPTLFSKWVGQQKSELLSYAKTHVRLFQQNKTYASRFQSALDKVTHSLTLAYQKPEDPAAFSFRMAEVMRKGEFIFLERKPGQAQSKIPHAELQIVDYLYANRLKHLNLREPIYVGVSKKCCGNCESAIVAFNTVTGNKVFVVRGDGHGFNFLAGIPEFLKKDGQIRDAFLMLRDVDTLVKAFVNDPGRISGEEQLLTPSTSVYESTSTVDSEEKSQAAFSLEDESSETTIPLEVSSATKVVKALQPAPELPKLPPPRSPQKPKTKVQPQAKKKNTQSKSNLSAPTLMFTPPGNKSRKKGETPVAERNKKSVKGNKPIKSVSKP